MTASTPKRIDWTAVRERMAAAEATLRETLEPSSQAHQQVLQQRARQMAQVPASDAAGETLEVLQFVLAHEHYALASRFVDEVYPLRELTQLPGAPRFVLGIVNVRGRIVSVIDIKRFFDLPERGVSDLNKVIILRDGSMEFGVLADVIEGVNLLRMSEIQPPLPTLTGIRAEYLHGVTAQRLIVLDAQKLIRDPAMVINETVES
ncbi:Chemotaxis protein CheW [Andreprevotia sp. IGB-42]|uniref:chemotaxis protein CheW n=1 Tax=Andreprevotia sp. IGB-42 TaxID=2497473 RepID=UPI0013567A9F|nr:chemotaxis protein CheW [Andreprevotia sp. IGB-42]KAF0815333.1 Chemotaxis protein CheW [Andreprevotia sp. IGB-42]